MSYKLCIPADVPLSAHEQYRANYDAITRNSGRLFLCAYDQKIEHMNDDFYGDGIAVDAHDPEHMFRIASEGPVGALAVHLGLLARYGHQYKSINYIVKLNGKTNLISGEQQDPRSALLYTVSDVLTFKKNSGLPICGIGITVYLGSEYEYEMLSQAAQVIFQAHQAGLVAIVWMYPRGHAIKNETDPQLLAGAAGVANALGADFVKLKSPSMVDSMIAHDSVLRIVTAAGNTQVIFASGSKRPYELFLCELYQYCAQGVIGGCAVGRNIFQRPLSEAIALTNAVNALVVDNTDLPNALVFMQKLS